MFIARAVQLGQPVLPLGKFITIPKVPKSPTIYEANHPDRIEKFPLLPEVSDELSTDNTNLTVRHELDHDTESVFWLLLYWVVGAQPEGKEDEPVDLYIWTGLTGTVKARVCLLRGDVFDLATHSAYEPLCPLLRDLAAILDADRHLLPLPLSDPRTDPGYINEAFQRLLLRFILDHRGQEFMDLKARSFSRRFGRLVGISFTSSPTTHRGPKRKLSSYFLPGPKRARQ
jgi:hypothetical protein